MVDHHHCHPPPLNLVDLGRIWHVASSVLSLHENLHCKMSEVTSWRTLKETREAGYLFIWKLIAQVQALL